MSTSPISDGGRETSCGRLRTGACITDCAYSRFSLVNRLIGQLIEEAADRDAIRAARRFTLRYREDIYRAAASHHRVLQLAETFPLAALAACADFYGASRRPALGYRWEAWEADLKQERQRREAYEARGAA